VEGPVRLAYPTLYIHDLPYDVQGAEVDTEAHRITLSNGTIINLSTTNEATASELSR
jgi:hypothetical protein